MGVVQESPSGVVDTRSKDTAGEPRPRRSTSSRLASRIITLAKKLLIAQLLLAHALAGLLVAHLTEQRQHRAAGRSPSAGDEATQELQRAPGVDAAHERPAALGPVSFPRV